MSQAYKQRNPKHLEMIHFLEQQINHKRGCSTKSLTMETKHEEKSNHIGSRAYFQLTALLTLGPFVRSYSQT